MAQGRQQPPPGLATATLPAAGQLRFTAEEQEQDAEEMNIHTAMPENHHATIARDRDARLNDTSFWDDLRDKSREAEAETDKNSRRNVPRGHASNKRSPGYPRRTRCSQSTSSHSPPLSKKPRAHAADAARRQVLAVVTSLRNPPTAGQ